jgi:hypothetical protein
LIHAYHELNRNGLFQNIIPHLPGGNKDTCNTIFLWEGLKGRCHLQDRGIDGKIILEWILGK